MLGGVPGVKTINPLLPDVPPPQLVVGLGVHSLDGSVGVTTVTWLVATAVMSFAGITDVIPLAPTKIVAGSGLPFHSTTEHGSKLLPLAVSPTGGPVTASTAALDGEIELRMGAGNGEVAAGCVSENGSELEFVPGLLPDTVIATAAALVARDAVSAGVIAAVSCVELTNVVARGEPFQFTTRPCAKPVPFTVRVKPAGLQYGVLFIAVVDAESEVRVGRPTGNDTVAETFKLDAGLATAI